MKRSAVELLPDDIKRELNGLLVSKGFSDYSGLADFLEQKGWQISRSALHRYGQRFEERLGALRLATEQADAMTKAAPDESGVVSDAVIRMCQERMLTLVMNLPDEEVVDNMPRISRAVADLSRAGVGQKRWMAEVKARAQSVAEDVAKDAKKAGLSDETVSTIRARILGITGD